MKVERFEKIFLLVTFVALAAAVVAIVVSVTQHDVTLPSPAGRIEPTEVRNTPPFDEPGLRELGDNRYEWVIVGQAWVWQGGDITVPDGAEVKILATSIDVIHGLRIPDTNVNIMVIPGQISEVDVVFDGPGVRSVICHEYCGVGHHRMGATVTVQ